MGLDPGRGGTGPGGLSGTFLGLLSAAEKDEGFLLSASPAFLISEGLRGKDDGLSSDGRFGNFSLVLLVAGLERTFVCLPGAGLLSAAEKDEGFLLPDASPAFLMSEGLRGKEDGLSSNGCFVTFAPLPVVGGLGETFG